MLVPIMPTDVNLTLAFEDIDECLYRILKDSLVYLKILDHAIDPMTEETYDYYKAIMEGEHA